MNAVTPFVFAPAVRQQVSLLIALAGASGSGKTMSALRLARGMAPVEKIFFIDTEARRGLHYAEQFGQFKHLDMRPPFAPARFLDAVRAAEDQGAQVVIIDSGSMEYDGEGGIMDWADQLVLGTPKVGIEHPRTKTSRDQDWWKDWEVRPVDSPGNWKEPKHAHKRMMNAFLQCRAHLIFCLRADEKIEIIREGGKTQVRPLGWMPICEKRFMYEMTASFTLTPDRPGRPSLSLPHKLQEQHRGMFPEGEPINEEAGRRLAEWACGGAQAQAPTIDAALVEEGHAAAARGMDTFRAYWDRIKPHRPTVGSVAQRDAWIAIAKAADARGDPATGAAASSTEPDDFPADRPSKLAPADAAREAEQREGGER